MDPIVQTRQIMVEVCLVVPPSQAVHTGSGVPLELVERQPEQSGAEMVQERGEPFPFPVPCYLPYTAQRL
jgi:hypothetical protein